MMVKTAVLVSGGGMSLQSLLDARMFGELSSCELSAVISTTPEAYALRRAATAGVPGYVVERDMFPSGNSFGFALADKLRDLDIELVVLAGFSGELPPQVLKRYAGRIIDSYPSLMPAFTGEGISPGDVCEAVLRSGAKLTGASAYFVTDEPYKGPIIAQKAVAVKEGDSAASLSQRVLERGENTVLPRAVSLFCEGRLTIEDGIVHIEGAAPLPAEEQRTK